MKLLSATVRNYRIHRETTVRFDPSRCLIGGPNESGKSTFIEAVHRGLFLKSRVTGSAQAGMTSRLHPGHPEVEVLFSIRGKDYRLSKRFSGVTGTTRLSEAGGDSWQGDEAESRLNRLLGVEEVGGGRNVADRVMQQWAHLWVWQGSGGSDPADDTVSEQAALLRRLQEEGGAIAMQSPRDARVAEEFALSHERLFTQAGRPKAGSDLEKSLAALRSAQSVRLAAADRLQRLDQAVSDYEEAEAALVRCAADLKSLQSQRDDVAGRLAAVERLRIDEQQQASAAQRAEEHCSTLLHAEEQIRSLQDSIRQLRASLEPSRQRYEQAQRKRQALAEGARSAAKDYQVSIEAVRRVRQRRDLARAWVEWLDSDSRHVELSKRMGEALDLRRRIQGLRESLAGLPGIDAAQLDRLRDLKAREDQARAALAAMAAGIEVLAADARVRIGDREAPPGTTHTVTETADVWVGSGVHLRIHPGGGSRLAETGEEVTRLHGEFSRELDGLALTSLEQAVEALARRTELQSQSDREESRLRHLDDGSLAEALSAAREGMLAAKGELERRSGQTDEGREPADRGEAVAWLESEDTALEAADRTEAEHQAAEQAARSAFEEADEALAELTADLEQRRREINEREAQLRLLIENHGEEQPRRERLDQALEAREAARRILADTQRALAMLQPELLERDRQRLARALQTKEAERQAALDQRIASRVVLTLDGSEDPQAELIRASAQESAAQEYHDSVRRRAEAIRLLHRRFEQQQKELADRFTQPLSDRISEYLQGVFGPDARAQISFEDGGFKGLRLIRPEYVEALPFDELSGGTREQVAAAVRLAIAELLAVDHGGSLPVVFDDSFAFSDPVRVQSLQRMLDLAAGRGLQVIVLTCNPSDYAALGATQVTFSAVPSRGPALFRDPGREPEAAGPERSTQDSWEGETLIADGDEEAFLSALENLGGQAGNQALREELGWADSRYSAVKNRLLGAGRIVSGRGRGGSIRLA